VIAFHTVLRVLLGTALLASGGLALVGVKALSAYRNERAQFQGQNHAVPEPPDAAALGLRKVTLPISDGLEVRGWFIPSRNGAAVAFVHGSPSDRNEFLPEARELARRGYGALLIDVPGHGESNGQPTWGRSARDGLKAAIDFLVAQPGITRIASHGFSMGSLVVARTAAEDPRIEAVTLAGVFTKIEDQIAFEFGRWFKPWPSVTASPALLAARRSGLAMRDLDLTGVVDAISPRPVLVIGGTRDIAVSEAMTRAVYQGAKEPKELLMVRGAGHGEYARVAGASYFACLASFLSHALAVPAVDGERTCPRN
jgi:pimeloyl-ACP methyl ester carboxylesterase